MLVSMGFHKKSYDSFQGRVHLQEADDDDASLVLSDVSLDDVGKFRCEVIDGIDDVIHEVTLEVQGSVATAMVNPSLFTSAPGSAMGIISSHHPTFPHHSPPF